MSKTYNTLVSMIIQGKTGEEYKKLLAGLSESERKEIKETKLSMHAAENFFNVFKIM